MLFESFCKKGKINAAEEISGVIVWCQTGELGWSDHTQSATKLQR